MTFDVSTLRLLACGLLLCTSVAQAKRSEALRIELGPDATPAQLEGQREQLRAAFSNTDDYAEMRASDRSELEKTLDRISGRLDDAGTLASLEEADRRAVLDEVEQVNALLATSHEDSQKVCRREAQIGSNRLRSVCMTAAQRRRQSENARQLRDLNPQENRNLSD